MSEKNFFVVNGIISVVSLSFLIWLIYFYQGSPARFDVSFLPAVNAILNSASAFALIMGYLAVKKNKVHLHKSMMMIAFVFSSLFLLCYIYYHQVQGDTKFLGEGIIRAIYFFILISHIVLSMIVFPMILTTFYFAFIGNIQKHKRLAKWTLPIWLYVSVTGVMIFFFLKTFNP